MEWRVAKSLLVLRDQVNAACPGRVKGWDGTIGDASHASRASDHNPWVVDDKGMHVVTAEDITNDPAHGLISDHVAEMLRQSRDKRIKYVISNRKIATYNMVNGIAPWTWRKYTGTNPHDHHFHLSTRPEQSLYDDPAPWPVDFSRMPAPGVLKPSPLQQMPLLRMGAAGGDVQRLQVLLNLDGAGLKKADGVFGPLTKEAVIAFQTRHKLVADGVVGIYSWEQLLKLEK